MLIGSNKLILNIGYRIFSSSIDIIIICEISPKYAILAKNSITVHPPVYVKHSATFVCFECSFHLEMMTSKSRHVITRIYAVEVIPMSDGSSSSF